MSTQTLFRELHRRHVFKSGIAYMVVSWLVVQVLETLVSAFKLPDDLMQFFIVVMFVCFPIWLLISWFYDITEDGIVRTKNIPEDGDTPSTKNVNLNKIIITSLAVIVILLIVNTFRMKAENKNLKMEVATENLIGKEGDNTPQFKTSIAVLAFANMTPEQDYDYLGDSMSEEIINRLNQIKDLKVSGRTSSFSFKNREVTHHTIAKELGVAYLLEGSIRISKEVVRITAQLIDASDGSHVWSQSFDRKMEDVLIIQDEIACIVADKLEVSLLNEDVRQRKADIEAYLYYLKANEALNKYDRSNTLAADSLIRKSLEIDNSYAPSWTVLSLVYFRKANHYALLEPNEGYDKGIEAAMKAVELDPNNAMGYSMLSLFAWQNKQANLAEKHLKRALDLSPNDPLILFQAGKLALRTNQLKKAKRYLDRSIELDPNNDLFFGARDIGYYTRSFLNWTLGNLDEAGDDLLRAYTLALPDYLKNYEMALLQRDRGQYEAAIYRIGKEEDPYLRQLLECSVYFAMGRQEESLQILEKLKTYTEDLGLKDHVASVAEYHYEIACLYAYMEDKDNAFAYLDKSFEHVVIWPDVFFTTPEFKNLHSDPRWEQYLNRLGSEFDYDFMPVP